MLSLALMGLLPPGGRVSGEAALLSDASLKNLMKLSERELLAAVPELPQA